MAVHTVEIKLKLPSCNEYINACRYNKYAGAKMKKDVEEQIFYYIKDLPSFNKPVEIKFTWIEESKRRDLDGICFAKKFILDALVKYGKLKDDNRKMVCGFVDKFEYADKSKVIVELIERGNE